MSNIVTTPQPKSQSVVEAVRSSLHALGHSNIRDLQVVASDDAVELRGRLTSYHQRQLAESAAMAACDGVELRSQIQVVK